MAFDDVPPDFRSVARCKVARHAERSKRNNSKTSFVQKEEANVFVGPECFSVTVAPMDREVHGQVNGPLGRYRFDRKAPGRHRLKAVVQSP